MTTTTGGRGDREVLALIIQRGLNVPKECREADMMGIRAVADAILAAGFGRDPAPCKAAQPCISCGGRGGYNVPYGDSSGWHDCGSCDGTGIRRAIAPPQQPDAADKPSGSHEGTGVIKCYHVARLTRPDGVMIFGKGDTVIEARSNLKLRIAQMEAFENDDPLPDWFALPMEVPPQQQQTGRDGGGE